MLHHNSYEYGRREYHRGQEENAVITLLVIGIVLLGLGMYIAITRLHIHVEQLVEIGLYMMAMITVGIATFWYMANRKRRMERAWPHPPVFIPMLKDRSYQQTAFNMHAIVPGYDIHSQPWYWSDDARRMQTLVVGQSGSGKTTLLRNIATQDIHRKIRGHHLPLIIFDGKDDQEFLHKVLLSETLWEKLITSE